MPEGPVVVVAESFSPPLAVALTERAQVAALVFCNSFVACALVDEALVAEVAEVVSSVPPELLASRVQTVLALDAARAFARSAVPALYIRGTEDRLVPDSAWQRMAALRPMSIARVPGPRLLLQANPAGAWQAVLEFLDALPAV